MCCNPSPCHSPAMPYSLAKPAVLASSLQRRCCCSSSARATSLRPPSSASRSSCSRCDGGGPPRIHPALPVIAAAVFVLASTTASCPRLHPARHAYTRPSTHVCACPHWRILIVDPWCPPGALLEPSSYPPRTLLVPSCQFVFGPMCGTWMDRADRRLVIRWGIGLQCAGVSLALCTYATQASNLRPADPRQACCCYSRPQAGL